MKEFNGFLISQSSYFWDEKIDEEHAFMKEVN